MEHPQESDDLLVLHARLEQERADAVLVQRPGDALVLLLLVVDDGAFPAQVRLTHVEVQIVGGLPDVAERAADVLDRALVDRIVGEVELRRPHALAEERHQLLDLRRRQGQLGNRRGCVAQIAAPVSSATRATSLSPRPLRLTTTTSPSCQRPGCPSTQATAWALSSAGRIPSNRLSPAKASSACRSVTASYNTRPASFR